MMIDAETFQSYRPLLFAIAYRMLGSATEAEDVLQDAFVRCATASPVEIRSPRAYLSQIVTRLCLDKLKAAQTVREQYLGSWLPEPVLTQAGDEDLQHNVEQHESITMAFLVLLESLTPQERAVFLLREVFEYEHAEIAELLGLSAANSRQIFHRAKVQVAQGRPRFHPAPEQQRQLVARFLAATQHGDVQGLTNLLAQDVIFTADGGGKVVAVRQPVVGRDLVTKFMLGMVQKAPEMLHIAVDDMRASVADVNGEPAFLFWQRDQLDTVFVCSIADDQITAIRAIRNPDKLAYIKRQLEVRSA